MTKISSIEFRVRNLLASVSYGLTKIDILNAEEFLEHNEIGVAFELICDQLYENNSSVSPDIVCEISRLACEMELEENTWNFLKKNVV